MKSTGTLEFYNTWAVAFCDKGLREYYANLVEQRYWLSLMRPKWGSHISVVRGEGGNIDRDLWTKYNGYKFDFEYSHVVEEGEGGNGRYYYWLPIRCPFLLDLREELGLARDPIVDNGLHLTLGSLLI